MPPVKKKAHIVYKFDAPRGPIGDGEELAIQQFRLASQYKNAMIGMARNRRTLTDAIRRHVCLDLDMAELKATELQAQLDPLIAAEKARKAASKAGGGSAPAEKAAIKALRTQLGEVWANIKAQKLRLRDAEVVIASAEDHPSLLIEKLPPSRLRKLFPSVVWQVPAGEGMEDYLEPTPDTLAAARKVLQDHPVYLACGDLAHTMRDYREQMRLASNEASKMLRKEFVQRGLAWPQYQRADEAVKRMNGPALPLFRRWRGEGEVAQHPSNSGVVIGVEEIFATNENPGGKAGVKLELHSARKWLELQGRKIHAHSLDSALEPEKLRKEPRGLAALSLRVSGDQWVTLPIYYDRPLPPGARILWAWIRRKRCGASFGWSAQIVMEVPQKVLASTVTGKVGIDIGWRLVPGGVRVAYWVGSDGREGQVVCPREVLDRLDKADSLRSIRDRVFDQAREQVGRFLASVADWPDWLTKAAAYMHQWKDHSKMVLLLRAWEEQRLPGDDVELPELIGWAQKHNAERAEKRTAWYVRQAGRGAETSERPVPRYLAVRQPTILSYLQAWEVTDLHLWDWEAHQRQKTLIWRKQIYQNFGRMIATSYRDVVFEDFDLTPFAEKPKVEDGSPGEEAGLRALRVRVAPAECRLVTVRAVQREGGTVYKAPAANTTRQCSACGAVRIQAGADLMVTCAGCKKVHDQDANAARNLLAWTP